MCFLDETEIQSDWSSLDVEAVVLAVAAAADRALPRVQRISRIVRRASTTILLRRSIAATAITAVTALDVAVRRKIVKINCRWRSKYKIYD